jgi:hypothetical protein
MILSDLAAERTREPFSTFVASVVTTKLPWRLFFSLIRSRQRGLEERRNYSDFKALFPPPITLCQRNFIYNADYRTFGRR